MPDQLVERSKQAARQHVGRDQRAHGQVLIDDLIGTDRGQEDRRRLRQALRTVGIKIGPVAPVHGLRDVFSVCVFPKWSH